MFQVIMIQDFKNCSKLFSKKLIATTSLLIILLMAIPNGKTDDLNNFTEFNIFNGDYTTEVTCLFDSNDGKICNCGFKAEPMILPMMGGNIQQINILNCKKLHIQPNTFSDVSSIFRITFTNIEDLILNEQSLSFPSRQLLSNRIQLYFVNTVIEEISPYTINGNVDIISFINCKIGSFRSFSISGFTRKVSEVTIRDTSINRLESQAFKKFSVDRFHLVNLTIDSMIPTRAIYDIDVRERLTIEFTNMTGIHSNGLIFREVESFRLNNNRIETLNSGCFQMEIREAITIQNNVIFELSNSAFRTISLDRRYFQRHSEPMIFTFMSNRINVIDVPYRIDFHTSGFNIRLFDIYFMEPIACQEAHSLYNHNQFVKQHMDTLYFKLGFLDDMQGNRFDEQPYSVFSNIIHTKCVEQSYLIYIIIGIVLIVILILIVIIVIIIYLRRRRRARQLEIIMPEAKTYRETQIVMQIEHSGLLTSDL